MRRRYGALIALVPVLTACGGGGGTGAPVKPVSTYRANTVGDSWTYDLSIDLTQKGSGTGSLIHGLSTDTYNGSPSIREYQTFSFKINGQLSTSDGYSELSTDGALIATDVNGTVYPVTSDTFNTGNTLALGTKASGVITLSNGETLTESFEVVGAQNVATPAGTFACWVTKQKVVDSGGITDNFTMWIAPETGSYVMISDVTTTPLGEAYTYTAKLSQFTTAASGALRTPPTLKQILGRLP